MGKNKKTYAYRPSDHVTSGNSVTSSVLGTVGIIGYALLIYGSSQAFGQGSVWYGFAGWGLFAAAAIGMYLAVKSLEDTAATAAWKIVGCVTNGIVLLFSVIILITGLIG